LSVESPKVVSFFSVITGKLIQCQVVKKFIDIHNYDRNCKIYWKQRYI